ncbi:hypothetical protein ABBQ32_013173 [Trebouxia sp. C0010 RCD-2024]
MMPPPTKGIVGTSKFAQRMKAQVMHAAKDPLRQPVLIFGEPGLEKDNIAAQVHYRSSKHLEWPMLCFDCAKLDSHGSQLFGRGSKQGLLHWAGEGTLLVTNLHKVVPAVIPLLQHLLASGTFLPSSLDVKMAPLSRALPAGVADVQKLFVRGVAKYRGHGSLSLTPEAVLQLESYSFPGNIKELQGNGSSAALHSPGSAQQLPEEVFWLAKPPKDLLKWNPLSCGAFQALPKKASTF